MDFSKIFATNGGVSAPTDSQYLQGFDFLGSAPPTIELFNYMFQNQDLKIKALHDVNATLFWQASTPYDIGDVRLPSDFDHRYLGCTVAGTSGTVEPTCPAVGSTVTDGGVTWIARDSRALALTGGSMSGPINEAQGASIASAATTNIGAATGNLVDVTGTTTITALGTVQAGTRRVVRFTGALTLTHNATSLILPGAANILTAAGDIAVFYSLGSGNWGCAGYQRASGLYLSLAGGAMLGAISMGSHKITGLTSGSAAGEAVHYGQFGLSVTANDRTQYFPTGTILKLGTRGSIPSPSGIITFDEAFPVSCDAIVAIIYYGGAYATAMASNLSNIGFVFNHNYGGSIQANFIAIGH